MAAPDEIWTLETLRIYMDRVFNERDLRYQQRFQASEDALKEARGALEKRLEGMNEFRSQLSDQAATFVPRREAEQAAGANSEKIAALTTRFDQQQGARVGLSSGWGYLVGGIGIVVGCISAIALIINLAT